MYSMKDLMYFSDPKGMMMVVYDRDTKKEMLVEGIEKDFDGRGVVHNRIKVYSSEMHKEYVACIRPKNKDVDIEFWQEYNEKFPWKFDVGASEWERKKYIEENKFSMKRFVEVNKDKYDLAICINSEGGVVVDAEPNIRGDYTLLKMGVSFSHGNESRLYKIRDNRKKKDYWTFSNESEIYDECFDASNNLFTNISINKRRPVFPENIEIENFTLQHKVYEECLKGIDELLHSYIKNFGIVYRACGDISIFVNRRNEYRSGEYKKIYGQFEEKICNLKEKYNLLNLRRDFESVLEDAVLGIEREKGVFHVYMECYEETVYSYDKEIIEGYVWSWFNSNINRNEEYEHEN